MREGGLSPPTRHVVDWQNPDFCDETKLDAEMRRVFDVCHGCRRCFNLCDSFPRLFDLIDATPSGEVHGVPSADFKSVVDACTLCDMCYLTKCPYVPPHEFNIDFPHLMLRYRAAETQKGERSFVDQEVSKIDRNGQLALFVAPLANWLTSRTNILVRGLLERFAAIHRNAELPRYAKKSFVMRAEEKSPLVNTFAPAFGQRKAVLYATCSMNYNDVALGLLTRAVLAKIGIETEVVYPMCCGMPQLEQGAIADVVHKAGAIAAVFEPWITKGYDVVALVPSCALMFKLEWPLLVPKSDPNFALVNNLAAASFDLSEYIVDVATKQGLPKDLRSLPGPVALHLACHARAQNMGAKAHDMLKLLPDAKEITVIERCSGHGGAWGIRKENFPVALKVGRPVAKKADEMLQAAANQQKVGFVASECPLAAMHIVQGIENLSASPGGQPRAWHPIEIFAMAYGLKKESV